MGRNDPEPSRYTHGDVYIHFCIKLKLGRVGMGRVLHLGPSWHGPSFMWAELVGGRVGFGPSCPAPCATSNTVLCKSLSHF